MLTIDFHGVQDTLGKVAKLLGNDLARAEEEYAEHVNSYRLYFKGLREREEKFSALKKNKNSLQSKIDNAEKKLAKMNPENKDLPNLTQKLYDLKNEMVGMEHAVINEDAALGDHRRHTARSATAHKVRRHSRAYKAPLLTHHPCAAAARRFVPTRRKDADYRRTWQVVGLGDSDATYRARLR